MVTRVLLALVVVVGLMALAAVPAGASEGPSSGDPGLSPLPTTWEGLGSDLAIWTAVVFVVLLLVLGKFAWRPIVTGLQAREQRIADEIASAERSNAEARQLLGQYEQRLAASGEEVQQLLDKARRDAEQVGREIVAKAQSDAEAEHRRALGDIEQATADAIRELAEQSATLAVDLAGRIVEGQLDPQAHSHLIEKAVADFARKETAGDGPRGG